MIAKNENIILSAYQQIGFISIQHNLKRYNRFYVDTVIEITRIVSHAPEAIPHASAMHWLFWNVLVFLEYAAFISRSL